MLAWEILSSVAIPKLLGLNSILEGKAKVFTPMVRYFHLPCNSHGSKGITDLKSITSYLLRSVTFLFASLAGWNTSPASELG